MWSSGHESCAGSEWVTMLDKVNDGDNLLGELAEFSEFGSRSIVENRGGVKYFINEYWTSSQRKGHRLHEVSYRACFKPQLPAFFIERLTNPQDVVYDPFMGRGTTPLEAALRGRVAFGNDANPLSKLLVEPRLNTPSLLAIKMRLSEIPWSDFKSLESEDLLAFYHPKTLAKIEGLKCWLHHREVEGELDAVDKWIRMVAINRLTGHSPGFFSVYTLPPNQATSVANQIKINLKRNQTPPERDVAAIIYKKSKALLGDGAVKSSDHILCSEQSDKTAAIPDAAVSLTVTSPPFLDIVNYAEDNWLRCWFAGIDAKSVEISKHRKIEDWTDFTRRTLQELSRITRTGGYIAYEVGEVRNGSVLLEEYVLSAAKDLPLEPIAVMINQQDFTKTSNCWGVDNNKSGTNTNRIVIFRKNNDH